MNIQPIAPGAPQATQPSPQRNDAVSVAVTGAQAKRVQSDASGNAAPNQSVKATPEAQRQALDDAVKKVNKFVEPMASSLKFSIDEESGVSVVKVIDNETKEVIRQMPSEEMLNIARALESLQGILLRQKA